jgi:hypothetical protein
MKSCSSPITRWNYLPFASLLSRRHHQHHFVLPKQTRERMGQRSKQGKTQTEQSTICRHGKSKITKESKSLSLSLHNTFEKAHSQRNKEQKNQHPTTYALLPDLCVLYLFFLLTF